MHHSVQNAERSYAMTTKKQLVKKILKAKKKILSDCVDRVQALLKQTDKLQSENILER